jgi:hypothetical protein
VLVLYKAAMSKKSTTWSLCKVLIIGLQGCYDSRKNPVGKIAQDIATLIVSILVLSSAQNGGFSVASLNCHFSDKTMIRTCDSE